MAPPPRTDTSRPRRQRLPDPGSGAAVVVLGLLSALAWGAGDFGGGMLSRRAPLFGVVGLAQFTGVFGALALAILLGEPLPTFPDIGWAAGAGVGGMVGISCLYRGLAVGRMGVVAPVTGVLGAAIPVVFGFAVEGVPQVIAIVGIVAALVAVVLVTRAPGHGADRPTGIEWALLAGVAIGGFNICVGQFQGDSPFGLLVIIRLLQAAMMLLLIGLWRQPWRLPREIVPRIVVVGMLDMVGNGAFILAAGIGMLAIATVLASLYPVTTVVLAIVILRERLTRSHVAGIVLTAVAIALIAAGSATG
jgi:drug/metabolite transporter (DMT)-like permease